MKIISLLFFINQLSISSKQLFWRSWSLWKSWKCKEMDKLTTWAYDSVDLKLSMLLILTVYLVYWIIIWQMLDSSIKGGQSKNKVQNQCQDRWLYCWVHHFFKNIIVLQCYYTLWNRQIPQESYEMLRIVKCNRANTITSPAFPEMELSSF